MSNLPLKALKWTQKDLNPLAELELTAYSALHEYVITEPKQGKFEIKKTRLGEPDKKSEDMTGFTSVKDAQDEAWNHYNEKMQPYVKPMPTWISVDDRLPEEDGLYLALRKGFTFEMGNASDLVPQVSSWNGGRGCFDDDYGNVLITHWMPIPEFSTMQNLHKGERCE